MTIPTFFLVEALRERFHAEHRSWAHLAAQITRAHELATGKRPETHDFIDRRKLKAICTGRKFVLGLDELEALDSYLEPFGLGLSTRPILRKPSVLETLADSGHVVFFVGARSHRHGWDLSLWDVNALAEIQRQVSQRRPGAKLEIRAVLLQRRMKEAKAAAKGLDLTFDDAGPSIVCLGSPHANLASEVACAHMFEVERFASTLAHEPALPFHFVRPRDPALYRSCIEIEPDDVREHPAPGARRVVKGEKWGLRVKHDVYTADQGGTKPSMTTCGVLVAQRRKRGQVWMVLAGLSGPGTLGAAILAREVDSGLSPKGPGEHSRVLWAPVVATSRTEGETPPELERRELLAAAEIW